MARENLQTSPTGPAAADPKPTGDAARIAELERENEKLRGELAEARAGRPGSERRDPLERPKRDGKPVLTEGERQDLEMNGVTRPAFGGPEILASDYDVEVKTDHGRERLQRAERDRSARKTDDKK
ncbi:MAG TPA: hypothetical protein VD864_13875 [Nocardioides sp.]|nr:hypothetical protein [Nocardioides sp.]